MYKHPIVRLSPRLYSCSLSQLPNHVIPHLTWPVPPARLWHPVGQHVLPVFHRWNHPIPRAAAATVLAIAAEDVPNLLWAADSAPTGHGGDSARRTHRRCVTVAVGFGCSSRAAESLGSACADCSDGCDGCGELGVHRARDYEGHEGEEASRSVCACLRDVVTGVVLWD